jgi:hypothetical protein
MNWDVMGSIADVVAAFGVIVTLLLKVHSRTRLYFTDLVCAVNSHGVDY